MEARINVLPDERFAASHAALQERLVAASALISAVNFSDFLDPLMQSALVRGLDAAGAHEGTVWLLDEARQHLAAAFNNGPKAAQIVGVFKQPLHTGILPLVLASEQPLCENAVTQNERQDKTLDRKLGLATCAMLAVPFYFTNRLRGVLSAVRLKPADAEVADPPDFEAGDLAALQFTATLLGRLIDHRLLALTLDRENL